MNDLVKAEKILAALQTAERQPLPDALPILNGLAGLIQGGVEQSVDVQDARAEVFMAICELGKAIHRGQPAEPLWAPAINATQRWHGLLKRGV